MVPNMVPSGFNDGAREKCQTRGFETAAHKPMSDVTEGWGLLCWSTQASADRETSRGANKQSWRVETDPTNIAHSKDGGAT